MKKYCYIENNEITLINQDLPVNWKNVSNFYTFPDDILKTYGWLPLTVENENKPVFVSSSYIIEENFIREVIVTRDKTEQEIEEDAARELEMGWSQVRNQRDGMLQQSDLFVLIDRWETLTEERKQEIRVYRQALRDIPQSFESPEDVVWPNLS
jgi:hypothetical protein